MIDSKKMRSEKCSSMRWNSVHPATQWCFMPMRPTCCLLTWNLLNRPSFSWANEAGGGSTSSSGNSGGAWVLADRDTVKWYTVTDATASAPPAPREASTLAAFESTQQRIGLVRGVVLEQRGHRGLVEGQSFTMETGRMDVPSVLSSGQVEIGTVPGLNGGLCTIQRAPGSSSIRSPSKLVDWKRRSWRHCPQRRPCHLTRAPAVFRVAPLASN